MTPFDLTQCPPPEGMEWNGSANTVEFEFVARRTSAAWVSLRGEATQDEDVRGWYVTVVAFYRGMSVTTGAFLPDLPSAYRRALVAVGLASPWTSEVPTEAGLIWVWHPGDDEPENWRLTLVDDGVQWDHLNYTSAEGNPFPPGSLFLPCPQPPKETPHG